MEEIIMAEIMSENGEEIWKKFLKKHWKILGSCVIGAILAAIAAILVYIWVVEDAQLTGLVPETLGLWSMGHLVTFLLHLIFWEVLFIGIPVTIVVVIIIFLWWKRLPEAEREEYEREHLFGTGSNRANGGGGISFLIFIAFIIKVYTDGKWNIAFADWTFDYLVYSFLWAVIWIVIIIGIPLSIGGIWWIHHKMKKNP
ncbi:MAG: hypothetical protein HXS47_00315 [Theionarchaea archaeon]|nr:hypothetical protein [Theionarchaea archaeon]